MAGGISEDLSNLEQDLTNYAEEAWTNKDIIAGFKLLMTLAGVGGTITFGIGILTSGIPFLQSLGIPITFSVASKLISTAVKSYDNLNSDDRKAVRKTVRFLRNIFGMII